MSSSNGSQTGQSLSSGPLADKARAEASATSDQFSNLAAARQTPATTTANGQNLTHYHSLFYSLFSWENPRATAISFVSTLLVIFITRYVPIVRYILRALWTTLGVVGAVEVASKLVLNQSLAANFRPKTYFTIPKETLEVILEDVEQLINFFVIEFQRILFAENVAATVASFFAAFLTYFLVKIVPTWGLVLLGTCVLYLTPLVYLQNKEVIDHHISNANTVLAEQTQQIRDLAAQHGSGALETAKSSLGAYATKAQEMVGQAKRQAVEKNYITKQTAEKMPGGATKVDPASFPDAPKTEPSAPSEQAEPGATKEPVAA